MRQLARQVEPVAPILIDDAEILAVALHVERHHGRDAPRFVAERIGALVLASDTGGIRTWRRVARQLDQLSRRNKHN